MSGFSSLKQWQAKNIRKALQGSVFIAPLSATAVTKANLFDPTTGALVALPAGYVDLGHLGVDGVKWTEALKLDDIMSWGSTEPVRSDVDSDVTTMVINPQETNQQTIGLFLQTDPAGIAPDATSGVFEIQKPEVASSRYFRVLVVATDTIDEGEIAICKFLPRARVTALADQSWANGSDPLLWGVTLTAYTDDTLGYPVSTLFGGNGLKAMLTEMGFQKTITCSTTSSSPTLTATAGNFFPEDVGQPLVGTGIPSLTTVLAYVDSTHVTMSANASATGTGVAVTLG